MNLDIEIFNQWLLGNYSDIKALEYFQGGLRRATGDGFIDRASVEFCDTMLNNEKRQKALDDLDDLESEASQKMEKCLREGKPDEYNKYMARYYQAAMLTNPLNAIEKAEHLKSLLVKDEEKIEYLKNCIAKITEAMISRKIRDGTNTEDRHKDPVENEQGILPPNIEDDTEECTLLENLKHGVQEDKKIYDAIKRGISGDMIYVRPREDKINFNFGLNAVAFLFARSRLKNNQIVGHILIFGEGVSTGSYRTCKSNAKDEAPASWDQINETLKYY
jgi:hypothetical protein